MQTNAGSEVLDYVRPHTLAEAVQCLADTRWRLLAGGTDLYPQAGGHLAGATLDLTGLPDLQGILRGAGLRIGAATSWSDIAAADLPPALRALQGAALQVGGRQIQNAATLGGNLCNASPAADGVPPLLVAGAEVELASASGVRRLPLSDFILGPRRTALRSDELLAAVILPEAGLRGRSAFLKLGARRHLVISIVMVAARIVVDRGQVVEAALAVGSCGPKAVRLPGVEAALVGRPAASAAAGIVAADVADCLQPIDDVRGSAVYRVGAAVELLRRAVAEALA
jgi:CO/xanthine dehydrogenase FAD-binding subunit